MKLQIHIHSFKCDFGIVFTHCGMLGGAQSVKQSIAYRAAAAFHNPRSPLAFHVSDTWILMNVENPIILGSSPPAALQCRLNFWRL